MSDKVCETCSRLPNHTLHSHHAIPRYMECSDDRDIIQVCKSCHKKADLWFERLILYPCGKGWMKELGMTIKGKNLAINHRFISRFERYILDPTERVRGVLNWSDPIKKRNFKIIYKEKYISTRRLDSVSLENISAGTFIEYNGKTRDFSIYNGFSAYGLVDYHKVSKGMFNMSFDNGVCVGVEFLKVGDNEPRYFTYWKYRPVKFSGRSQTNFVINKKRKHMAV